MASGTLCETQADSGGRKEGRKWLFNDKLNTFHLRLYGVGHMVNTHSDCERGNPLLPHGLILPICSKGSFICTDRIAHTTAWNEKELNGSTMKDRADNPSHHERMQSQDG